MSDAFLEKQFREIGIRQGWWDTKDPVVLAVSGGGDSIAFRGEPLTKLGVFAIRQGPILHHNLQAVIKGEPLQTFHPQPVFLYILNLGTYEGLAIWGPLVWEGANAWKLKDYIDRKFMKLYQYPEDEPGEVKAYFDRLTQEDLADVGRGITSLEERTAEVDVPGEGDTPSPAISSSVAES